MLWHGSGFVTLAKTWDSRISSPLFRSRTMRFPLPSCSNKGKVRFFLHTVQVRIYINILKGFQLPPGTRGITTLLKYLTGNTTKHCIKQEQAIVHFSAHPGYCRKFHFNIILMFSYAACWFSDISLDLKFVYKVFVPNPGEDHSYTSFVPSLVPEFLLLSSATIILL